MTATGTDCRIVWMQDIFSLVKLHMCYMFIKFVRVVLFNDLNLKKCFLNFQDDVFSSERPGFYFYFHAFVGNKKIVLKIQVLSHRHDLMFNGSHPSSDAVHFPRSDLLLLFVWLWLLLLYRFRFHWQNWLARMPCACCFCMTLVALAKLHLHNPILKSKKRAVLQ